MRREGELPRPEGNNLYSDSRYFYLPPVEPSEPRCGACVECSGLNPALAMVKCFTCIRYDPRKKGLYCMACFQARHPWHRDPHTWLPMSQVEDLDAASKGQRVRAELDHRVVACSDLLSEVSATLRMVEGQSLDPLPEELLSDSHELVDHAEAQVQRVRRKLRDDIALRDAFASGKMAGADDALSQQSRGWEVEPVGSTLMSAQRTARAAKAAQQAAAAAAAAAGKRKGGAKVMPTYFEQLRAAVMVERVFRKRQGRKVVLRRVAQVWSKAWSKDVKRWYFVNDITGETRWTPPLILQGDIDILLTPRTFARRKARGDLDLDRIYRPTKPAMDEDGAATAVQACWRRKQARRLAAEQAGRVLQRVKDTASGKFYYFNASTGQTSWKRPAFLTKAAAEAAIQTPRGFALRAELEQRAASAAPAADWGLQGELQAELEASDASAGAELAAGGGSWPGALALPAGWTAMYDDASAQTYYWHETTGNASWEFPTTG